MRLNILKIIMRYFHILSPSKYCLSLTSRTRWYKRRSEKYPGLDILQIIYSISEEGMTLLNDNRLNKFTCRFVYMCSYLADRQRAFFYPGLPVKGFHSPAPDTLMQFDNKSLTNETNLYIKMKSTPRPNFLESVKLNIKPIETF